MEFQTAKEIYWYFMGDGFQMSREGVYDQYKAFKVSEEQEQIWRKELIESKIKELPDKDILWMFSHMVAHEAIPDLLKYSRYGDGFFKCRLAETLFDIVSKTFVIGKNTSEIELLEKTKDEAKTIWTRLLENPCQEITFVLNGSNELVNNAYITNRAADNLTRYNDLSKKIDAYKIKLSKNA